MSGGEEGAGDEENGQRVRDGRGRDEGMHGCVPVSLTADSRYIIQG